MSKKDNKFVLNYYELNLIFIFLCLSLIVKFLSSNNYILIILNILFEFLTILFFFQIIRYLQLNIFFKRGFRLFLLIIYHIIFLFDIIINFISSYYLDESYLLRYSFYNFDTKIVLYFFDEIFPYKLFFSLIILLIFVYIIAKYVRKTQLVLEEDILSKKLNILLLIMYIVLIFCSSLFSNVYINSISQGISSFNNEKIVIDDNYTDIENDFSDLDKNKVFNNNISIEKNQRVLVFVMESVPYNIFQKELKKIPNDENFFRIIENSSHIYTNYYTTNQDSATSLVAMLWSKFVPYDAYSTDSYKTYIQKFENKKSIVDIFNYNNYSSNLVVSASTIPKFLSINNWTNSYKIENFDELQKTEYFCLEVFQNEQGCEDKAMLNDIKKTIKNNDNLFLFQELIYGHSVKYELEKKQSITNYYNYYFLDIYEYLKEENLLDNTTIVITSDHGLRNLKDKQDIDFYQVPFIVFNSDFDKKEVDDLYSHIDFNNILLSYLTDKNQLKSREEVFIVGQTRTNIIGYKNNDQSFFVRKNGDNQYNIIGRKNISKDEVANKVKYFELYKKKIEES